jgi:class 3 adenylate cyclase/uncharacterized protein (DUF427 family)
MTASDLSRFDDTLRIEPCFDCIRVEHDGTWIASSKRAVILHESRLPPVYYLPFEDVNHDYLRKSETQTHCPFKGNATHWPLRVGGETTVDAVWAYEDPYAEGEALRGYVAFDHDKVTAIYRGDDLVEPGISDTASYDNPLVSWAVHEALAADSNESLYKSFVAAMQAVNIPVWRVSVIIPNLHPQAFACQMIWEIDESEIVVRYAPHDLLHRPVFSESPVATILNGAGGVRRRLEGDDIRLDYAILEELLEAGATDYCAMPFKFSDGQTCILSISAREKGGFRARDLNRVYEILPALGRLFEVHTQRNTAIGLLEAYLGAHTGRRVLQGQVKLGDGDSIHAVIWFSDFRDSTALSESMAQDEYLAHLNRYFDCVATAVIENGGEVLRYIGDAVLAIFPISDAADKVRVDAAGTAEACRRAIKDSQEVAVKVADTNEEQKDNCPPIKYGIGLHLGDVTYGNIGIPQRLEFTVIGLAANQAARVESMTKEIGETVLVSQTFADQYSGKLTSVGRHALKGVPGEHELFALAERVAVDEDKKTNADEMEETVKAMANAI